MTRRKLTVAKLFDQLKDSLLLELVGVTPSDGSAGGEGGDGDAPDPSLARQVTSSEISSPGLVLAGFTDRFVSERIQVLGETEIAYLLSLSPERRCKVLATFFAFHIPCVFVTK